MPPSSIILALDDYNIKVRAENPILLKKEVIKRPIKTAYQAGLQEATSYKSYSEALKLAVVKIYLRGNHYRLSCWYFESLNLLGH